VTYVVETESLSNLRIISIKREGSCARREVVWASGGILPLIVNLSIEVKYRDRDGSGCWASYRRGTGSNLEQSIWICGGQSGIGTGHGPST